MTEKVKKTGEYLVLRERIARSILRIRGQNVMLDRDIAELYGVSTKNLNRAVTRNADRFPEDFMFRLSKAEFESLRFHFGTSKLHRKKPVQSLPSFVKTTLTSRV